MLRAFGPFCFLFEGFDAFRELKKTCLEFREFPGIHILGIKSPLESAVDSSRQHNEVNETSPLVTLRSAS